LEHIRERTPTEKPRFESLCGPRRYWDYPDCSANLAVH
jgi:hypothetical protein